VIDSYVSEILSIRHDPLSRYDPQMALSSGLFVIFVVLQYSGFPATVIHLLITWLRRTLYQSGVARTTQLQTKVISIGNLTTRWPPERLPLSMMIADKLRAGNLSTAVLSRGYRSLAEANGVILPGSEAIENWQTVAMKLP